MTKYVKEAFGYTVVGLACAGVVVNLAALSILMFKKRHSIFHNLLKVLAVYDLLVCCGCALLYGFPNLWDFYADRIYRRLVPWVVPIAHMAMMSSVYSTMLMSFERYIRICHLCQLRNVSYITKENYKFYVLLVVIIPILFYIPKFFEVRAKEVSQTFHVIINCSEYLNIRPDHPGFQGLAQQSMVNFNSLDYPSECTSLPFELNATWPEVINITRKVSKVQLFPTELRSDPNYYNIYCLGLNTSFAMILPLLSLLFLNLKTVRELKKMMQTSWVSDQVHDLPNQRTNGSSHQSFRFGGSLGRNRMRRATATTIRDMENPSSNGSSSLRGFSRRGFSFHHRSSSNRIPLLKRWSSSNNRKASVITLKSNQIPQTSISQAPHELDRTIPCVDCLQEHNEPQLLSTTASPGGVTSRLRPVMLSHCNSPESQRSSRSRNESVLLDSRRHVFNDEQRKAENRLTRISMSIVWLFIFCHVWRLVPTLYESIHVGNLKIWPDWLSIINDLSHTLIVFNSAVNFLIYVFL